MWRYGATRRAVATFRADGATGRAIGIRSDRAPRRSVYQFRDDRAPRALVHAFRDDRAPWAAVLKGNEIFNLASDAVLLGGWKVGHGGYVDGFLSLNEIFFKCMMILLFLFEANDST